LIEEFEIKINGSIVEQDSRIKDGGHIIDINNYAKNLYGRIIIKKSIINHTMENYFTNSYAILYFDGNHIIKLNNLQELDLNNLTDNNNIPYCQIPLLKYSTNEKYNTLLEIGYMDEKEHISNLGNEIENFIYLFSHKDFNNGI
jgi:hypothetical protein